MKIDFGDDLKAYQQARQLHFILDHYAASDHCNESDQSLLQELNQTLEKYMQQATFAEFNIDSDKEFKKNKRRSMIDTLSSLWHALMGPSRMEVKLSEQRRELIERAERAEAMAFEALAETTEITRQRDEALKQIEQQET